MGTPGVISSDVWFGSKEEVVADVRSPWDTAGTACACCATVEPPATPSYRIWRFTPSQRPRPVSSPP